jgi:hypothetical protein
MKYRTLLLGVVGLTLTLTAATAAYADVHLNIDLNPYGWGAPPPVVYEPPRYYAYAPRYYAPPPVVYYGHGHWGDHRGWRGRDHDRGRWEHHERHYDEGDRR